ncbi:hypothetical protein K449DRAFT_402792 [Hypoxylon sp. EC38]|nr:hypothetical protein K449DRAFT_402792 [Hypoxylon sp. EC38]
MLHHVPILNQEILNPILRYGHHGEGKVAFDKLHLLNSRIMLRREKKDHTGSMNLPVKEIYVGCNYEDEYWGFHLQENYQLANASPAGAIGTSTQGLITTPSMSMLKN